MDNYTTEEGERMHQLWNEIFDQYQKMRVEKGHTLEIDLLHVRPYELNSLSTFLTFPDDLGSWDRKAFAAEAWPHRDQEWIAKTLEKTYKDRLKVGISLLIAELERIMYLENQRISNNDSSTASSSGDPESNG